MNSRRIFLQQAGLMAAGLFIAPKLISCTSPKTSKNIGLQLYTLRNEIGSDVPGVIAKVAAAGYTQVETYGYSKKDLFWGMEPQAFKDLLSSNGLTSPSGHYDFNDYFTSGSEDQLLAYIEAANVLEQTYITAPYLEEHLRKTADDYKSIAAALNRAAETCRKNGLKLAYHNHDFEFQDMGGTTGYQILLNETDPSLVQLEADLYWIVRAGLDPVELFEQHQGRFVMWHVKDMDKADKTLNTEVGNGSIDFKRIFDKIQAAGTEYFFVEQENFSIDPFQSITSSCNYVKENLL